MPTNAAQTVVVEPGADAEQARLGAHCPKLHGCPGGTWAAHAPQTLGSDSAQLPLAHCQELLHEPPIALVPPCGMHEAALSPPRNWSQLIAPSASPHCAASACASPL